MANVSSGVKGLARGAGNSAFGEQELSNNENALYFSRLAGIMPRNLFSEIQTMDNNIQFLVDNFVKQIVATVEAAAARRVQAAVSVALGAGSAPALPRRRGRPPKASALVPAAASPAPVKRRPKQLCPVPGCKGLAAPVFGMVCSEHKKMSKALIKKYRAQRRAKKAK